ncbi:MAG: type II secretion system F family protein [Geodermatophilaceae bacterium]|nr:type II secretion system F family protein [Geodermatophilaceae bacterium]MDQ3466254.1 type II secretion system F family protein [Actinomycetota bacterium]
MTPLLDGVLLGLAAGTGLLLVLRHAPPLRPIRLQDRLAPYVSDAPRASRLLTDPVSTGSLDLVRVLLRPVLGDAVRILDRFIGGRTSVRRRLDALGSGLGVEDFRVEQVIWGALGLGSGAVLGILFAGLTASVSPLSLLLFGVGGLTAGVVGRDWWLTQQVSRREATMLAEFPVVAELLALAVTAGEGPVGAIDRVCRLTGGELGRELSATLASARSGLSLVDALQALSDRTSLAVLSRFVDGIVVATERGTPLADVLRAQAADVREAGKRRLLEAGGRKEIAMMVPVVFLVLPVTVLFALYPGLVSIVRLAQ